MKELDDLVEKCMDIVMTEPTAYKKECAFRELLQQKLVQVNGELVKKIMNTCFEAIDWDTETYVKGELESKIRKLLQSRLGTEEELKFLDDLFEVWVTSCLDTFGRVLPENSMALHKSIRKKLSGGTGVD